MIGLREAAETLEQTWVRSGEQQNKRPIVHEELGWQLKEGFPGHETSVYWDEFTSQQEKMVLEP